MNPKVDEFLSKAAKWPDEMKKLRTILLSCGLTEELKWGKPCYAYDGSNIVIIQPFKDYCALLFFKGYLLKDPEGILVKTGENTRVGRQVRFTSTKEISGKAAALKAYIYEAIEVEKAGLKGDIPEEPQVLPQELKHKLAEMPALKNAFHALTPGRQRAYLIYFSQAKQSKTREARIDKSIAGILNGKGLNE
jgi:uncharacterized protein YdeI (YjbR/CyaY-like superfamily)